ncbi:GntR family transcriptional regulator [Kineococcus sp. T90]|nr:GntR family transcriptional regulator [Kineococcus indalonis]NAZ86878.1 GntR family transcriptional regulator [Kineococcus indalonis]
MSAQSTEVGPPRGSLADHAYEHLRGALLVLDVRPGEPLNDEVIARRLGIGRTPVREALERLGTDRLVVAYPRRGTFATAVDTTDPGHTSEVRRQLERTTAQLDPAVLDARTLMRHDVAVHRGSYRASGNPHLQDVLVRPDNLATRIGCLVLDRLPTFGGHVGEHAALLRAIVEGRTDAAADLAAAHVEGCERAVRAVLRAPRRGFSAAGRPPCAGPAGPPAPRAGRTARAPGRRGR